MKKVLIVEDDMILTMYNKKLISSLGLEIVGCVRNGKDAIECALNNTPDVILMDIRIQGDIDGITTMEIISKTKNIPVIYMSGNSDQETMIRAKQTNMIGFITKPISEELLKKLLKN